MTPSKLWVSASLLAREAQYELHQCSHMFIQHVNNLPDQNGLKAHVDQQTKDRNEDRKYFGYASKNGHHSSPNNPININSPPLLYTSQIFPRPQTATMSQAYEGQDPMKLAQQAERDLNSSGAKNQHSAGASDSTNESGVDQSISQKFPGASVTYGSAASGAGDNREIPLSEGGDINPTTGKPYKAGDFEGTGGPEDKARAFAEAQGGSDDVRGNIRQGGETIRPSGNLSNDAAGGTGKQTGQESG
ncbi:hypothetical protein B0A50_02406 [Salinomyces thailandicus]|uniref:Uncharacterized protein n=1 Tax=Salinomyces thailandicus TaxID=706561 RepID=A0A4U0U8C2_9PEZI|nr:hypothetical protein B0A50_02406 [Salinomyces thailandica]